MKKANPSSVSSLPVRSISTWGSRAAALELIPGGIRFFCRDGQLVSLLCRCGLCTNQVLGDNLGGFDASDLSLQSENCQDIMRKTVSYWSANITAA